MSKILKTTVISAVALGIAAASPLSAQARTVAGLDGPVTLASCSGGAALHGTVTGNTWTVTIPASVGGVDAKTFQYRARSFNTSTTGKQTIVADKLRAGSFTASGTNLVVRGSSVGAHIFRLDISDPAVEAAGTGIALLYTSDGAAACD